MSALARLDTAAGPVDLRRALLDDLPAVVDLLADDPLGAAREQGAGAGSADVAVGWLRYRQAFAALDADPAHLLVVAEAGGEVVATMQVSVLPGLARHGALRAQLEAVRVRADLRGTGLGQAMVRWAVDLARTRGCDLVQLTSDKRRPDAHRFYARLGFEASHEGFKLAL